MKTILLSLAILLVATFVDAATNDQLQSLSGVLLRTQPKDNLMPCCLVITEAGRGIHNLLMSGSVLDQFKSGTRLQVQGIIKTRWVKSEGTQPTPEGWIIWMEVQQASVEQPKPEEMK